MLKGERTHIKIQELQAQLGVAPWKVWGVFLISGVFDSPISLGLCPGPAAPWDQSPGLVVGSLVLSVSISQTHWILLWRMAVMDQWCLDQTRICNVHYLANQLMTPTLSFSVGPL